MIVSQASDELKSLAETLAQWVDQVPGIPAIYLFGSRVRGDHRPDSDIDVRLYLNEWNVCEATSSWWDNQNETDFAEIKSRLPGPLSIHREKTDDVDSDIRSGRRTPILVVRKVVCVWTPSKTRL